MKSFTGLLLFLLFVSVTGLAHFAKPSQIRSGDEFNIGLHNIIPDSLNGWKIIPASGTPNIIDPQMEATIRELYTDEVSRAYVNDKQDVIMLSVAYGAHQTDQLKVHEPDICYPAQGFVIDSRNRSVIETDFKAIPVTQLQTHNDRRKEFVTYWVVTGDKIVESNIDRKLIQIKYAFNGKVPSGLIYRVSSIGQQSGQQFLLQEQFINSFLSTINEVDRQYFLGKDTDRI